MKDDKTVKEREYMIGYAEKDARINKEADKECGFVLYEGQEDGTGCDTLMDEPSREIERLSQDCVPGEPSRGKGNLKRCLYQIIVLCVLLSACAVFGRWFIASRLALFSFSRLKFHKYEFLVGAHHFMRQLGLR